MKILFINTHEDFGGAEEYIDQTAEELESRGHEIEKISLVGEKSDINFSQKFPRRYLQRFFAPIKVRTMREEIKSFDPDVIHTHNIHYGEIPILRLLKNTSVPVIKTFHDYTFFCECEWGVHGKKLCEGTPEKCLSDGEISPIHYIFRKPLHKLRTYLVTKSFEKALAPSKDLTKLANNWIKTETLHNFVDLEKYSKNSKVNKKGLLYFGRIADEKGIDDLLHAYSEIENPPQLKIAGKGDETKYRQMAEDLGIKEKVKFKGFVPEEEIPKLLQGSQAIVIPSKWRENSPLTLLESMAAGTPVIAPEIGGFQDYIENEENGYLFDFRDIESLEKSLKQVITEEPSELDSLSTKARETAEKYDLNKHTSKLEEVYESIRL